MPMATEKPDRRSYGGAKDQIRELEAELAEFQASSRELEREMELELEEAEMRQKALKIKVQTVQEENKQWKSKYLDLQKEYTGNQALLLNQMHSLKKALKDANVRLREIEMTNDDMERHDRITKTSLNDLEQRYFDSLESIAMLESEVAAKDEYQVALQRTKDELRDTKEELSVAQTRIIQLERQMRDISAYKSSPPQSQPSASAARAAASAADHHTLSHSPVTSASYRARSVSSAAPTPLHVSAYSPPSSRSTPSPASKPSPPEATEYSAYGSSSSGTTMSRMTSSKSLRKIHGMLDRMRNLENRVASFKSSLPQGSSRSSTPTQMSPASATPSPPAPSLRRSPSLFDRPGFYANPTLRKAESRRNLSLSGFTAADALKESTASHTNTAASTTATTTQRTPSHRPSRSVLDAIQGSPSASPNGSPSVRHHNRRSMLSLNTPSTSVSTAVRSYDRMISGDEKVAAGAAGIENRPASVIEPFSTFHSKLTNSRHSGAPDPRLNRPGSAFSALHKRQSIGHGR